MAITILDSFVESSSEELGRAHLVNNMTLILHISMAILDISGCRLADERTEPDLPRWRKCELFSSTLSTFRYTKTAFAYVTASLQGWASLRAVNAKLLGMISQPSLRSLYPRSADASCGAFLRLRPRRHQGWREGGCNSPRIEKFLSASSCSARLRATSFLAKSNEAVSSRGASTFQK